MGKEELEAGCREVKGRKRKEMEVMGRKSGG